MTINTDLAKEIYDGNGVTTAFPFGFKVFVDSDLEVTLIDANGVETLQVLNTDYTVDNAGFEAGGSVTFTDAPADGVTVLIKSAVPYTQPADYKNQGRFFPETHEDSFDRATRQILQLKEQADRSFSIPAYIEGVSTDLPAPEAGTVVGWDGDGTGLRNYTASTFVTSAAFSNFKADVFNPSAAQTQLTLSDDAGVTANLDVSIDGIVQVPGIDYTLSGATVTFTTPFAGTERVLIRYGTAIAQSINAASGIEYTPVVGSGTTVEDALDRVVYMDGAQTITGDKTFVFNPATAGSRLEIQKDASPVNYAGTRASLVFQHRDTADGGNNEGIPAAVFLSTWDGDGVVTALPNFSATVGQGVLFAAEKYGDGSMHSASFKGQLWAGGAVGYNELALQSGDVTNRASMNGYIAGTEWLLKDGTGAGTSGVDNFPTALQGFVSRIAKWNSAAAPNYPSINFLASSEGTVAPDSILGINNGGLKQWKVGVDLRNGTYTTGAAIALPNAGYLFTNDTGGTSRLFLGTNAANSNVIYANGNSGYFQVVNGPGTITMIECNDVIDATNPILLYVNGALKRVTVGAADSGGAGFRYLRVPN